MHTDSERCLRAVRARDPRFDGWFVTAVRTTGIYCRPSCPAVTPRPENVEFHPSAAAAQRAGFRACKRCRPDASPGSPAWDHRADVAARAVRLIGDGVVDREGVAGLATRLGYSARQLERHLVRELGAGPLALARAQRARTARTLVETSDLPLAEVAFAAGFGSVRSFNDTLRTVYGVTPGALRRAAGRRRVPRETGADVQLHLRLPLRTPFAAAVLTTSLAANVVPGVEEWRDGAYRRTLRLPRGHGIVELVPATDHVACRLRLTDLRDLAAAVRRCRHLLDLDADPEAVDAHLGADPLLAPSLAAVPGRRVLRSADPEELALRAVLAQQVSSAAARTAAARLVAAHGTPVEDPDGGLTHLFPTADAVAGLPDDAIPAPRTRRDALRTLAAALATGAVDLGPGADRVAARATLSSLRGIGPWTVEVVAMRGLGDPDAFPVDDHRTRAAARASGLPAGSVPLTRHAERWRPWRAYAVQHLWSRAAGPATTTAAGGNAA